MHDARITLIFVKDFLRNRTSSSSRNRHIKHMRATQIIPVLFISLVTCIAYCQKDGIIKQQPNVLLIMVDDLNDYQGVFGGHPQAKTPNIDRLAKSGTIFTNAHTNVPVCQPSRNSLFTGVYPHDSRDFGWTPHMKQAVLKNHKTLVELFKENGYLTLGTGKLLHKNNRKSIER